MKNQNSFLLILALLLLPLSAQAQSDLFGEKLNENFVEKIQPGLLEQAADPATSVHEYSLICKRLGVYGDRSAVPVVASMLGDPDKSFWARTTLEEMPFPEAAAALRKAVGVVEDATLRAGIINSLGMIDDQQSVGILLPLLSDKNPTIETAAMFALARFGNPSYSAQMIAKLDNANSTLAGKYADTNLMYGDFLRRKGHFDAAEKVFFAVAQKSGKSFYKEAAYFQILLREDGKADKWFEPWLTSDDPIQYRAALRAAQFASRDTVADAFIAAFPKVGEERKVAVLIGIGTQKNPKVVPILLDAVASEDALLKDAAVSALKDFADSVDLNELVKTALSADAQLRKNTITLIALMSPSCDAGIVRILKTGSPEERELAVELIGVRRIATQSDAILALASHAGSTTLRAAAFRALGEFAETSHVEFLVAQIVKPASPELLDAAKTGLKTAAGRALQRDEVAAIIYQGTHKLKGNADSRLFLFQTLGSMGTSGALEAIHQAATSDDLEAQDMATNVLGRWINTDAAATLLQLANTPDYPYARRALRGYLRLARQFSMPDWLRRGMVRDALASPICGDEEREIADIIVKRYQLDLSVPETESQKALRNIVICSAIYGLPDDAARQKDVTREVLNLFRTSDSLDIRVPESYNVTFGGDPAPGVPKTLTLKIRFGNSGEIRTLSVREGGVISLPKK
ncbi:MAG: HEAT repeat domain-containing protein [Planctomycetia bacterium]|nr:HEAT repeat domain-containing protein [Planctomycetia bacterium]